MSDQHPDSFRSAATFASGRTLVNIFRLDALAGISKPGLVSPALLPPHPAGKSPPPRRRPLRHRRRHYLPRQLGPQGRALPRDRLHARPRPDAGLHRRPRHRGPRRHARRHETLGGDPKKINPLQPAELVIDHSVQVDESGTAHALLTNAQLEFTRNRERYAFLRWGRPPSRTSGSFPPTPASSTRSTWSTSPASSSQPEPGDGVRLRLSRHPRRHRLPHHHGQRPRRPWLGRRRHRGRGRHARTARLHAYPPGRRLQAHGQAEGGHHRHRPRSHRHRRPCASTAWSASSSSSTAPASPTSSRRPRHHRQHGPRIRCHLRHLPRRQGDPQLPPSHRPQRRAHRAGRRLLPGEQGLFHTPNAPEPSTPSTLARLRHRGQPAGCSPKCSQDRLPFSQAAFTLAKQLLHSAASTRNWHHAGAQGTFKQ